MRSGVQDSFASSVTLILGQGQFKSMLHFHDELIELIEAIERRDAKAAVREVVDLHANTASIPSINMHLIQRPVSRKIVPATGFRSWRQELLHS
jgi:hypothetical protein